MALATVENLVLDLFRCRVVIGERGVTVLEFPSLVMNNPGPVAANSSMSA